VRVIIADDSGLIRDALARTLPDYGVDVCGTAGTTDELRRLVEADPPDIVTLDIAMPVADAKHATEFNDSGLAAARHLRQRHPEVGLLALSQYAEVPWAAEIAELGMGVGYLVKDRVDDMAYLVDHVGSRRRRDTH
jgi:DNA-binding NarL/FixJ family response regulator